MDSATLLQQLVNAVSLGSMYALIAIGYTMVYGILRLINFAHADIMMVGAFLCFFGLQLGLPFWLACVLAVVFCAFLGITIDRIAYRPLRFAPRISILITAIGVSFLLENSFMSSLAAARKALAHLPFSRISFILAMCTSALAQSLSQSLR